MTENTTYAEAELITRGGSSVAKGTAVLSPNESQAFFWPDDSHLLALFDEGDMLVLRCGEKRLFVKLQDECDEYHAHCPKQSVHYHLWVEQQDPARN